MIKNIEIHNFRGIKEAKINDFGRINVFFGKNNCGKSSLLEALFLATGISNPILPISINSLRGYSRTKFEDLASDFYNQETSHPILLIAQTDTESREVEISLFQSNSKKVNLEEVTGSSNTIADSFYGIRQEFRLNGSQFHSELIIPEDEKNQAKVNIDQRYQEPLVAEYIPSNYPMVDYSKHLERLFANKQETLVLKTLREIDSHIQGITLVGQQLMVDIGRECRYPINLMGDGMRKLVALLANLYVRKGGVILIDEIDNGFHYSVMPILWKSIIDAAITNDIQIFATTHNMDSLKGLNRASKDMSFSDLSLYKLIGKQEGILAAIRYNTEQFSFTIEQELELR